MREDEPAGFGLDGRAAVADLHGFPRLYGPAQKLRLAPEMGIVRKHQEEVFVVLPRDHRVAAVDAPREERHAFVLHGAAIERDGAEAQEIAGLEQLREDRAAIVGGVSGVVDDAAVVLDEADEARVLHAVALIG